LGVYLIAGNLLETDPAHPKATRSILIQNIPRAIPDEAIFDAIRGLDGYLVNRQPQILFCF
jgi:hypothetical protein